jgi:hypothetical protein
MNINQKMNINQDVVGMKKEVNEASKQKFRIEGPGQ